ncbi:MAG: leucine-rich repeat domain-containing protein [Clostridia bacterium]|nr:leucine-rich repeat domain-containing protein [Clostridia bacterium]
MGLVVAVCPRCGATLKVDPTEDALICEYCGAPFIVEKAIQKYQQGSADFEIRAGELISYLGSATEIKLPDGLLGIGKRAFAHCKYLKSVTINEGLKDIEWEAFIGCSSLTEVFFPKSIQKIDYWAFDSCISLNHLHFQDGGTEPLTIQKGAFRCCQLEDVTLPANAIAMPCAFAKTKMKHANLKGDNCHPLAFPPYASIDASESWKKQNWFLFDTLSSYEAPVTTQAVSPIVRMAVYEPQKYFQCENGIYTLYTPGRFFSGHGKITEHPFSGYRIAWLKTETNRNLNLTLSTYAYIDTQGQLFLMAQDWKNQRYSYCRDTMTKEELIMKVSSLLVSKANREKQASRPTSTIEEPWVREEEFSNGRYGYWFNNDHTLNPSILLFWRTMMSGDPASYILNHSDRLSLQTV